MGSLSADQLSDQLLKIQKNLSEPELVADNKVVQNFLDLCLPVDSEVWSKIYFIYIYCTIETSNMVMVSKNNYTHLNIIKGIVWYKIRKSNHIIFLILTLSF